MSTLELYEIAPSSIKQRMGPRTFARQMEKLNLVERKNESWKIKNEVTREHLLKVWAWSYSWQWFFSTGVHH